MFFFLFFTSFFPLFLFYSLFFLYFFSRGVDCSIDFESLPMPDLKKLSKIVTAKSYFFAFHFPIYTHHTSIFCFFLPFPSFPSLLSAPFENLPNLFLNHPPPLRVRGGGYETLYNSAFFRFSLLLSENFWFLFPESCKIILSWCLTVHIT